MHAGVTQLVECQLPKLNVAGSSPVTRSIKKIADHIDPRFLLCGMGFC